MKLDATLYLENGAVFRGKSFGAAGEAVGEVVFNTSLTGYQEILSDPSYKGQMVVMTAPMIGNYGVNDQDGESPNYAPSALIVREHTDRPSGVRQQQRLGRALEDQGVIGLSEIDTRQLTRLLREEGAMMGILSTNDLRVETLKERLAAAPRIEEIDLVEQVTTPRPYRFKQRLHRDFYHTDGILAAKGAPRKIAILDYGMKASIARTMVSLGAEVTVYPAKTSAEAILRDGPEGVLLSNGPGDPRRLPYAVSTVEQLVGKVPIFGICLGHQLLGMALGGKIVKLKFGHHGANHPVQHLGSGSVLITSQNHNYAVDPSSLDEKVVPTHTNLNDGTLEGLRHATLPVESIQFHPEAAPGPHDALFQFHEFLNRSKAGGG